MMSSAGGNCTCPFAGNLCGSVAQPDGIDFMRRGPSRNPGNHLSDLTKFFPTNESHTAANLPMWVYDYSQGPQGFDDPRSTYKPSKRNNFTDRIETGWTGKFEVTISV